MPTMRTGSTQLIPFGGLKLYHLQNCKMIIPRQYAANPLRGIETLINYSYPPLIAVWQYAANPLRGIETFPSPWGREPLCQRQYAANPLRGIETHS